MADFSMFQAIFLGIVQGLTELLPVSSSAHLTTLPWLLWGIEDIGAFDVALHAGTLLAIGIFFFKDWISLLVGAWKTTFKKEKNRFSKKTFNNKVLNLAVLLGFVLQLCVIYIPGVNNVVFQFESLSIANLGISVGLAFVIVIVMEIAKLFKNNKKTK